jgi:hypothetical protein
MKQETFEEVAKSHAIYELENNYKPTKESFKLACKRSFIRGAKWQQERMYSEKEVLNIIDIFLCEYRDSLINKTDFYPALRFEQFKKK